MSLRDGVLAGIMLVVFGVNFAVMKVGLQEIPPFAMTALRFFLVAALLLPFVKPPPRTQWRAFAIYAFTFGVIHFSFMFTALARLDASIVAIMVQAQVPISALLAAIFFNDRLGWRRAVGMAIALAGVAILIGEPRVDGQWGAVALILIGVTAWAVSNIQVKKLEGIGVFTVNAYMALLSAPILAVLSLTVEGADLPWLAGTSWVGWAAALYQAVGVVILGYGVWYTLLGRYKVNQLVPLTLLVPVLGVVAAIVLLGEPITLGLLVGGGITLVGVAIIVIRRPALAERQGSA